MNITRHCEAALFRPKQSPCTWGDCFVAKNKSAPRNDEWNYMTHIFLYGPPGTGKSTIGKIIARNLKLPFIDLDRVIETNAGMSISQIMEQQGKPAFRDMETTALIETVGHAFSVTNAEKPGGLQTHLAEAVIALGGGALLRDENRAFAESQGKVILLMAEMSTLLERLQNDSGKRPLLAGDSSTKLSSDGIVIFRILGTGLPAFKNKVDIICWKSLSHSGNPLIRRTVELGLGQIAHVPIDIPYSGNTHALGRLVFLRISAKEG